MYIVIFITAPNKKEARHIAKVLLKARLIACANIVGNVKSLFWWQGKINNAKEALLVIKSKRSKLAAIIKQVKSVHSYQLPEIIAIPVMGGEKKYLNWIDECIGKSP